MIWHCSWKSLSQWIDDSLYCIGCSNTEKLSLSYLAWVLMQGLQQQYVCQSSLKIVLEKQGEIVRSNLDDVVTKPFESQFVHCSVVLPNLVPLWTGSFQKCWVCFRYLRKSHWSQDIFSLINKPKKKFPWKSKKAPTNLKKKKENTSTSPPLSLK